MLVSQEYYLTTWTEEQLNTLLELNFIRCLSLNVVVLFTGKLTTCKRLSVVAKNMNFSVLLIIFRCLGSSRNLKHKSGLQTALGAKTGACNMCRRLSQSVGPRNVTAKASNCRIARTSIEYWSGIYFAAYWYSNINDIFRNVFVLW